jgi:hypothetical protein
MLVASSAGFAAEPRGWKTEITPYFWYVGIDGDVEVLGNTVDFERSARQMFKAVDGGGSLLAVVQKDRYLFWAQGDLIKLSTDELDVNSQPRRGSLDTKVKLAEAAVGYQIDGWSEGQTFDLMLGARNSVLENDLSIYALGATRHKTRRSLDPMIVVRPSLPITERLRFNPTIGLGAGGDADFVYELQPQLQYQISDTIAARVGYRRLGYKITKDRGNEINFALSGLIFGVGVTF